jgi:choline-glycine betaine transporter
VFWPPFTLLIVALSISLLAPKDFVQIVNLLNNWVLNSFGGLFSVVTLVMVICCAAVFLSPIRNVKIGGKDATPLLTRWQWFSIILCTTVATGILFWGTAEPLYHLSGPPAFVGVEHNSQEAGRFAISTLFLHWSFTPYAIYTIPALCFAIGFYNRKRSFSLQTMLFPLTKNHSAGWGKIIDAVCLYALVLGMAASLGAGILTLSGGISFLTSISKTWLLLGGTTLLIVFAFVLSAISGLLKGIKNLSSINAVLFFILAAYLLTAGPTAAIASSFLNGIKDYFYHFPEMSLLGVSQQAPEWSASWSNFYWANWMAWAPVSALFLGRIAKGYTVKEFMIFNWIIPSVFAILWMSIFGGTAIDFELQGTNNLIESLNSNGPESVMYKILEVLPYTKIVIPLFLIAIFLSFVTAADSNTEAMSALSQKNDVHDLQTKTPTFIKIIWGVTIGLVAFTMISFSGIDGIKQLSNLGGLPILFFLTAVIVSFIVMLKNYKKGDV